MMADVVPFPSVRRRAEMEKLALRMLDFKADAAEGVLRARLDRKRESLRRKGVKPRLIVSDLAAFEGAVRAMLWKRIMPNGGGAA